MRDLITQVILFVAFGSPIIALIAALAVHSKFSLGKNGIHYSLYMFFRHVFAVGIGAGFFALYLWMFFGCFDSISYCGNYIIIVLPLAFTVGVSIYLRYWSLRREQVGGNYAGLGFRCRAAGIDALIFIVYILWLSRYIREAKPVTVGVAVSAIFLPIVLWLFHVVCHAYWGKSLGKMLVGIRVVTLDGSIIGWYEALLRSVVSLFFCISLSVFVFILTLAHMPNFDYISIDGPLSSGWIVYLRDALYIPERINILSGTNGPWSWIVLAYTLWSVGEVVMMLSNSKCRAIHDFLARTMVIRESELEFLRSKRCETWRATRSVGSRVVSGRRGRAGGFSGEPASAAPTAAESLENAAVPAARDEDVQRPAGLETLPAPLSQGVGISRSLPWETSALSYLEWRTLLKILILFALVFHSIGYWESKLSGKSVSEAAVYILDYFLMPVGLK